MRTLSAGQYRNVGACLPACLPGPLLLKHSLLHYSKKRHLKVHHLKEWLWDRCSSRSPLVVGLGTRTSAAKQWQSLFEWFFFAALLSPPALFPVAPRRGIVRCRGRKPRSSLPPSLSPPAAAAAEGAAGEPAL